MRTYFKYKTGLLKGYTIRVSKNGWYALYNNKGVSQTNGKYTLKELKEVIKSKKE